MHVHNDPQLVNYTANLTEERDELNQALEEAKKALQKEMAMRISLETRGHLPSRRQVCHCVMLYSTLVPCNLGPSVFVSVGRCFLPIEKWTKKRSLEAQPKPFLK